MSLNSRTIGTIVEDLPTSQTDWRKTVCFAGEKWEYDGVAPAGQVPNAFQPIGKKDYTLSAVEQSRIARVLQAWN